MLHETRPVHISRPSEILTIPTEIALFNRAYEYLQKYGDEVTKSSVNGEEIVLRGSLLELSYDLNIREPNSLLYLASRELANPRRSSLTYITIQLAERPQSTSHYSPINQIEHFPVKNLQGETTLQRFLVTESFDIVKSGDFVRATQLITGLDMQQQNQELQNKAKMELSSYINCSFEFKKREDLV